MVRTTKSTLIAAGAAVLIAGAGVAGGVAAARADDSTPAPTSTASPSSASTDGTGATAGKAGKAAKAGKHAGADALAHAKGVLHAQWVTTGKGGTYVSHDAIRGTVSAVSSSSLTIKAKDGVTQTYALSGTTTVTLRPAQGAAKGTKATKGAATDVKTGAAVVVLGTGTSTLTADRVVVGR